MPELTLYHFESCPFCAKVRSYLSEHNIQIPMKDIDQVQEYRDELIALGGKSQVPCLIIDGKEALYESDAIIEWFKNNYKEA